MNQVDLGPRSKEALSWMVIAEVLKLAAGTLRIAVLHPGGGLYDTLSLVTPDGDIALHVNRNGVNALASDQLVEGIWDTAVNNPRLAALRIMDEGDLPAEYEPNAEHAFLSKIATNIANYLTLNLNKGAYADWGWVDSTYGVGPNLEHLELFSIPNAWKELPPAFIGTEWHSNIYLLFNERNPIAAINMRTGEAVDSLGEAWDRWPNSHTDDEGNLSPHIGFRVEAKDQKGATAFSAFVHPTQIRKTKKMLGEELFTVELFPAFDREDTSVDEGATYWNSAEGYQNQIN